MMVTRAKNIFPIINWRSPRGSGNKIHIDEPALREDIRRINHAKGLLEEALRLIPDSESVKDFMIGTGATVLGEALDQLKKKELEPHISAYSDLAGYIDHVIKRYQAADSEVAKSMGGGSGI